MGPNVCSLTEMMLAIRTFKSLQWIALVIVMTEQVTPMFVTSMTIWTVMTIWNWHYFIFLPSHSIHSIHCSWKRKNSFLSTTTTKFWWSFKKKLHTRKFTFFFNVKKNFTFIINVTIAKHRTRTNYKTRTFVIKTNTTCIKIFFIFYNNLKKIFVRSYESNTSKWTNSKIVRKKNRNRMMIFF